MKTYKLDADITFQAKDFPDACRKIATHFLRVVQEYKGEDESERPMWFRGELGLEQVK